MIIKSIKLQNFRNHSSYELECKDETSLILGKNGCGKTSVLEALYILMQGKSFRATDIDILKKGEEFYRVEGVYQNGETMIVSYDGKDKIFYDLNKKNKRLPKNKRYPVVLFLPSDLHLISSSPSRRRRFFDVMFSQLNETYHQSLNKYEKALKQRNELLKKESIKKEDLFSWDILLAKYGTIIYRLRKDFIDRINQKITEVYQTIAKNNDEVRIELKTQLSIVDDGIYFRRLEEEMTRDIYLGHTGFGIHRDDFEFIFNNKKADGSASRGEARSIILAMKFIEAEMIFNELRMKPVVLLDDVFSELDDERRKCLVENFKDNQVIITSVEKI